MEHAYSRRFAAPNDEALKIVEDGTSAEAACATPVDNAASEPAHATLKRSMSWPQRVAVGGLPRAATGLTLDHTDQKLPNKETSSQSTSEDGKLLDVLKDSLQG